MTRAAIVALAALSLIVALASCGRQGELERPSPLWGAKAKAEYSAQQRNQAAAASNAAAANRVSPPQDPALKPYTTLAPITQAPIPGERPAPSGAPQTGETTPQ